MKIGNAFSLNMVQLPADFSARRISVEQIKEAVLKTAEIPDLNVMVGQVAPITLESVIGHADTARLVSGILGVELPANRDTVNLQPGEKMIVAQYSGPRLPEGATKLPEGAKIEFVLVEVE